MKFYFTDLVLWLKNGEIRSLNFEPNKVNIITGGSSTGKTAILDILDYCLFASRHKISHDIINENVEWYGIRFFINGKTYLIARKSPNGSSVSTDYYFSSTGDIPEKAPETNIVESSLKTSLESDFSIDRDTKIAYGGKQLKANSKISLRFFLVLNTISQDIITHSEEFFDKQKDQRYREALPRTFDLAVGIDTVSNILKREKHEELSRYIRKLEREESKISRKQDVFQSELTHIIKTAKEYALVSEESSTQDVIASLRSMVEKAEAPTGMEASQKYEIISGQINETSRKIRNLLRFSSEYKKYKSNLKETSESLKPLEFLAKNYEDVIKTSIYKDIIASLQQDHSEIRKSIANKTPLDSNVSEIIKSYEDQLISLREQLASVPKEVRAFQDDKSKFIFIGETKAKLDLYTNEEKTDLKNDEKLIASLQSRLASLVVENVDERRDLFVKVLDETIQEYIELTKSALENYANYLSSFNYKDKKLQLRKPKTDFIDNIGSSSNHMFLHLYLFLGLHELIIQRKAPHVPPFLIIDQFSRPYWGDDNKKEKIDNSDIPKVKLALELLNNFIENLNKEGEEFQMIVFEHISPSYWEGLKNIHLVEEFRDGNALIPLNAIPKVNDQ